MVAGAGGGIKHVNDWKFQRFKGTNLGYDKLCEYVNSDREKKKGYLLNGNFVINVKNLITIIDNF